MEYEAMNHWIFTKSVPPGNLTIVSQKARCDSKRCMQTCGLVMSVKCEGLTRGWHREAKRGFAFAGDGAEVRRCKRKSPTDVIRRRAYRRTRTYCCCLAGCCCSFLATS